MMSSGRLDRLLGVWMSAALVLWASALVVLWASEYDLSGGSFAITVAALCLAFWSTAGWPGRLARGAQRLLPAFGLRDMLASGASRPAGRSDEPAMSRLLAAAASLAAAGALVSTGAVFLARDLAGAGAEWFMWDTAGWAAARLAIEWASMLPMALGMSLMLLLSAMARAGAGLDGWSPVVREHIIGAACGLGAMGAAWWVAADALGVALVACVALLAGGAARLQWPHVKLGRRHGSSVVTAGPSRGHRLAVAAGFAGLAAALTAQMRIMRDVMGLGFGGQLVWAALSLGLVVVFLGRRDSHGRLRGELQAHGSLLGLLAGLVLQCALVIRCAAGGAEAALCGFLAVAAQVPLAALAGAMLSRQRRQLAYAGGRPRQYLASATAGIALAMLFYATAGAAGMLGVATISAAIAVMVLAALQLIQNARRPGQNVRWTALCGVLICACGMALSAAWTGLGQVSAGRWLTAWTVTDASGEAVDTRFSPRAARWRSESVSTVAGELLARRAGRWWLVVAGPGDAPAPLPAAVTASWAQPDRSAGGFAVPGARRAFVGDFLGDLARDRRKYDGIYLCPLSASHPEAWRCFSLTVLAMCREKLLPGGVLAVRTQVDGDGAGQGLAVAASFEVAVGSGWAVLSAGRDGGLDLLLIGPAGAAGRPEPVEGALVVPLGVLLPPGRTVRPLGPGARWSSGSSLDALMRRLGGTGRP